MTNINKLKRHRNVIINGFNEREKRELGVGLEPVSTKYFNPCIIKRTEVFTYCAIRQLHCSVVITIHVH